MLVSTANIINFVYKIFLHAENHQQISEKVMKPGLNPEGHHM